MSPLRIRNLFGWLGAAILVGLAVRQELNTDAADREWHGEVLGFVPYDFRFPTVDRFLDNWWNPDLDRILTPTTIVIGWSFNIGRMARLVGLV